MISASNVLRSAAPISINEFFRAFATIWPPATRSRHRDSLLNVGLAISGGVDSMALAALCSRLNQIDLAEFLELEQFGFERQQRLCFKAFIVDHGARIGSHREASLVSENLKKIGIPAQILRLQWPCGCKPAELSNFESVARTLRYQALGKACYAHKIQPLLTAHHEDDQVETVIMRLLRGERGINLHGMRPVSHIPECDGIYGVNRSGAASSEQVNNGEPAPGLKGLRPISIPMESGGVQLYRPLLNFSKSRLIATSIHLGSPWFEDKTNADPTLTPRNTIRHFYQNDLMPQTLSKTAILQLAHKMQIKDAAEEARANSLLFKPNVLKDINWSSGSLKVRFPKFLNKEMDKEEAHNVEKRRAARFLRRLIYFVTPNENVLLSSLGTACEAAFPELFSRRTPERSSIFEKQMQAFTVAGVYFTRMAARLSLPAERLEKRQLDLDLDENYIWGISRQASRRSEKLPCITFPPPLKSRRKSLDSTLVNKSWSRWHLYDGRFWIRISNRSFSAIIIRPFHKTDMNRFDTWPKHMYSKKEEGRVESLDAIDISKEDFARFMKKRFPGDIRYTLPAIVARDEGRETVLALPSIGIACRSVEIMRLDWEIRYKCVDWIPSVPANS